MKQKCIALIGFTLSLSSTLEANPVIPERQSSERYDKLTEDWPFSIETPLVPAPANPEGPFTNFYLSGIGRTHENGKEQVFVAISSRDKQVSFSLFGSEKGHDDICVTAVEWNDIVGKSRVTLKKGNETGVIGFDEMAIKTPALAATPKLPQRAPGANPPAHPNQGSDPARGPRVRVIR